jgi:hypothetical protein
MLFGVSWRRRKLDRSSWLWFGQIDRPHILWHEERRRLGDAVRHSEHLMWKAGCDTYIASYTQVLNTEIPSP